MLITQASEQVSQMYSMERNYTFRRKIIVILHSKIDNMKYIVGSSY